MDIHNAIYFPKPTGPYAVGTTSYHVVDESRTNEFAENLSVPCRELMIQVWYPAQENLEEVPSAPYAPDAINYWKTRLSAAGNVTREQLSSLDQIFVYAKISAVPARTAAPFSVVIFSPGFGQMRTHNTALCENVASYGYVVVSIDYTYVSEQVTFPDGRSISAIMLNLDTLEKEQHLQDMFVDDVAFVLTKLKELNNDTRSSMYHMFDLDRIGISGHSIGGSTALFATKRLGAIKAGINIDGGTLGNPDLLANFDKPFMHIIAQESIAWLHTIRSLPDDQLIKYGFKSPAHRDKIEKGIVAMNQLHTHQTGDVYRVVIHGAGHMSFCDAMFLKDNELLKPLLHLQFGIGTLSGQKATELASRCLIAFFDKYLKNESSLNLTRVLAVHPEIDLQENPKHIF